MARHTLLFYFLQFLPLLASASAGFDTNCIDFDLANVDELISTLRTVENSEIKTFNGADEDKMKNQPFGNFKTDWSRLQLLQEALPADSILKDKFKYIFRLLLIAHDQAIRFSDPSESTKIRGDVEKENQESLPNKNHTDAEEIQKKPVAEIEDLNSKREEIREKLENIPTTPISVIDEQIIDTNTKSSFYELGTIHAKSTADGRDTVESKEMTKASAELGEAKRNNVATNTTNLDLPINSSTTIAAPIPILEAIKSSAAGSISNADTTISEGGINIPTSIHEESEQSTATSLSESTSAKEDIISMGQATKMILEMETSSPVEEEVYEVSSKNAENSSFKTIPIIAVTEMQTLKSSSSESGLLSTTEEPKSKASLQPAIKVDPVVKSSITEKYPPPATVSSIVPTKSQSFVSTSTDKLQTSSLQKTENISLIQSTTDTLLAENFTADLVNGNESILRKTQTQSTSKTESYSSNTQLSSEIQDSATFYTKVFTTENTSTDNSTIEENEEIDSRIPNTGTENSSSPNLLSNAWTTDSAVNNQNITLEEPGIELTKQINQHEDSMTGKSISKVSSTIDWIENASSVTPTSGKNEDNISVSQNNQTEVSITEKSTANLSTTKSSMKITSDVSITVEKDRKSKLTSPNQEKGNSTDYVERISNVTPTIDNNEDSKLSSLNNRIGTSNNGKTTANVSATNIPVEYTSDVPIETEQDKKDRITSLDNETEKLLHVNETLNNRYTTNSIQDTSTVISEDKNEDNKLETPNNQTETLVTENSTINIKGTKNPFNHVTVVTPLMDNEKIGSTSKNIQKEILDSEYSTSSQWSTKDSTESVQITPSSTMTEEIKSTTQNDERKVAINDKSVSNDNDTTSTSTSTSALNTSNLSTNTVQFVAKTFFPSYKTTQYFVSTEPSITEQEIETSTQNYVSEQSTIITNKITINIPTDSGLINQTELSEADFSTENATNYISNNQNPNITSNISKDITIATADPERRSDSETWRTNAKPSFEKNPLNTGSSRSNKIFQDFKHGSDGVGPKINAESPQIVLYGTGGSVWRPHLVRQQPSENNIRKFDSFPNNVGPPYGYGYKQPAASSLDSKTNIRKDEKNPVKLPGQGSRMNLLRSRKRGSANSDVEKQFRWFYRHGRADTAHESRDKENDRTKIKIQCKKTHRR